MTVINELPLEEYLYGVIKMEVDPRWPSETLKAQAVAARTLALYSLNRFAAEGYDVRATTDSQVYGGIQAEDPRATTAVEETRGLVITYRGTPILSVYHSDSGGHTESSEYVWGGSYAYLRGVADPYAAATPGREWISRIEAPVLEERLRRAGKSVSGITAIEATAFSPSGRVLSVVLRTTRGRVDLKATEIRAALGPEALRSTLFTVHLLPGEVPVVEFVGRGSGHGVGMSQWGARGQGLQGRTFQEILRYYYTDVTVEQR
jgi:stage II sporulation protein D